MTYRKVKMGSGCGTVCRPIPEIHGSNLVIEKTKMKKKEVGTGPFK